MMAMPSTPRTTRPAPAVTGSEVVGAGDSVLLKAVDMVGGGLVGGLEGVSDGV